MLRALGFSYLCSTFSFVEMLVKHKMFSLGIMVFQSLAIKVEAKLELSHWEPGRAFQHLGKSFTDNYNFPQSFGKTR